MLSLFHIILYEPSGCLFVNVPVCPQFLKYSDQSHWYQEPTTTTITWSLKSHFLPIPSDARFELQQEILTVAKRIERAPLCRLVRRLCERTVEPVFPSPKSLVSVYTQTRQTTTYRLSMTVMSSQEGPPSIKAMLSLRSDVWGRDIICHPCPTSVCVYTHRWLTSRSTPG